MDAIETGRTLSDYLKYFLKGVYDEVDNLYPNDDDAHNKNIPTYEINNSFQGTCIKMESSYDIAGPSPNGFSGTVYFKYDLDINPWNDNFISNMEFLGGDQWLLENVDNSYYLSLWDKFEECTYESSFKSELRNGEIRLNYNSNAFEQQYSVFQNETNYTNCCNNVWTAPYYSLTDHTLYILPWKVEYTLHDSSYNWLQGKYVTVDWHGSPQRPDTGATLNSHILCSEYPAVIISNNPQIENVMNHYYEDNITHNTYNDYNVYNGDNFIYVNPPSNNITYDDLVKAIDKGVNDINVRLNLTGDTIIKTPTYDDFKYGDRDPYYIAPVDGINVPSLGEVSLPSGDFGDAPKVIAESVNDTMSILDHLGITTVFIICALLTFIIRKVRD